MNKLFDKKQICEYFRYKCFILHVIKNHVKWTDKNTRNQESTVWCNIILKYFVSCGKYCLSCNC